MDGGSAVSVSFSARVTGSREVMRTRLRPARARSSSAGTSSAVDIFCAPSFWRMHAFCRRRRPLFTDAVELACDLAAVGAAGKTISHCPSPWHRGTDYRVHPLHHCADRAPAALPDYRMVP